MEWAIINYALIIQLFVLLNPLSSFPFLMAAYRKKMDVKRIAAFSVMTAFVIAIIIIFIGPYLFDFFGITLNSFRVAGGIVLLLQVGVLAAGHLVVVYVGGARANVRLERHVGLAHALPVVRQG